MTALSRFFRRHYEQWKSDTLTQSDFRPSVSILLMSFMAIFIGIAGALVAWVLYRLIGLVTHIAFAGRIAFGFVEPALLHPPVWAIVAAPIVGGLLIGLMARYGTDRIRGHGIPEALEAILFRQSKMMVKVAILKPVTPVFFGEGALLEADSRSATIRADGPCTCLVLTRHSFYAFAKVHPQWALPIILRIARTVMDRLHKTNNDLMLLYHALVSEIRGN